MNIAEILKDCPKGMELECTMFDDCTYEGIEDVGYVNILIKTPCGQIKLSKEGYYIHNCSSAKCVIFPKGKTTWEGFQRPFKDGDILATDLGGVFILKTDLNIDLHYGCYAGLTCCSDFYMYISQFAFKHVSRLATEEEKQKLFKAIKDRGYKWNAETKTLEKLIVPKFKVGDRVERISTHEVYIINHITSNGYMFKNEGGFKSEDEHLYRLVSNKFDISTLKPFESKVLVRSYISNLWKPAIFGFFSGKGAYVVGGVFWTQVIPYEGNEHLLGTTSDCDEYYKTWE